MVKSAPTSPLGPAALLGSSSIANSTARGVSASCAEWCQPQINCPSPTPTIQEKLEHQSCPPVWKKQFAVHGESPLSSDPQPTEHVKWQISFRGSIVGCLYTRKRKYTTEIQIQQIITVASVWKRHFGLPGWPYILLSPFQFLWSSRCHVAPMFLKKYFFFPPISCYKSDK